MGPKSPYAKIVPPTVFPFDVPVTLDAIAHDYRESHGKNIPSTDVLMQVFLRAWSNYRSPRRRLSHPGMNAPTWSLTEVKRFVRACATGVPDIQGAYALYKDLLPAKKKGPKADPISDLLGGV